MGLPRTLDGMIGVRGRAQWLRCAFPHGTDSGCVLDGGVVGIGWHEPSTTVPVPGQAHANRRGMTFDRFGRLYRADPDNRAIDVTLFRGLDRLDLRVPSPARQLPGLEEGPLRPIDLAADGSDHLFVIGDDDAAVHVYDLWREAFVRRISLPRQPLSIRLEPGGTLLVLLDAPSAWLRLSICDPARLLAWPAGLTGATRLAITPCGEAFVLIGGGTEDAELLRLGHPRRNVAPLASMAVPFAREIAAAHDGEGTKIAVAGDHGQPILRFTVEPDGFSRDQSLDGRFYDGASMATAPTGDIVFHGVDKGVAIGPVTAAAAKRQYLAHGEIILFGLDCGKPSNRWGRLFLDACMPDGTAIVVETRTTDVLDKGMPVDHAPPLNSASASDLVRPGLTYLPAEGAMTSADWQSTELIRTDDPPDHNGFRLFEGAVRARAGRYLWLRLTLTSGGARTPRIRRLLVEKDGHDWLKHLPRAFARRSFEDEGFLHAYLSGPAGLMTSMRRAADERHVLFDPDSAPGPALSWLGATVGLPLEANWPEDVSRKMIREANSLFARRGTVGGLKRMLEILTGDDVVIVEAFRLRAGGGIGGAEPSQTAVNAALGFGFRLGGGTDVPAETDPVPEGDAVTGAAHRFTVMLRAKLGPEQMAAVRHLLDRHRPAHTIVDVCTVDNGLRVGVGAHVGLTSFVGPTSGLLPAVLGSGILGKGTLLARGGLSSGNTKGACS